MPTLHIDDLNTCCWEKWPAPLTPADVAVFRYPVQADEQPWLSQWLSDEERQRASRFRQEADRYRFVAGRGWLRWLAGQWLQLPPQAVPFTTGPTGKLDLVCPPGTTEPWHVNLSHSGEWVLLVAARNPVGIDVEWVRPNWPYQDLLASSFTTADQNDIAGAADPQRAFYTFWTRKESLFKATGQGLTNDFMAIPVSKGVRWVGDGLPETPDTWQIRSFPVAEEYVGAVACSALAVSSLRFFTLEINAARAGQFSPEKQTGG